MSDYTLKQPKQLTASIKDMDMKLGIVTGYAASFNTLDSDNDIIMPGAFSKTIRDQGPGSAQPRYLIVFEKAPGIIMSLSESRVLKLAA